MVRVHPGGAPQVRAMPIEQRQRFAGTGDRGARDDHAPHAAINRPCQHGIAVSGKTVVRQVRPDVNQVHSQGGRSPWYRARMPPRVYAVICLPLLLAFGVGAHAQAGGDPQAQILYAYETEDSNRLAALVQRFTNEVMSDPSDAAARYHLAHADYRLAGLGGRRDKHRARQAVGECISVLKPLVEQDVKSDKPTGEASTLQAACYFRSAQLNPLEAVIEHARGEERLHSAQRAAPNNPRVLYITALEDLLDSKPGSAVHERGFEELQRAARAFDQSSATREDAPGWGHAEAYLALSGELKARGEQVAARNWLEKALLAAPDYKAAQHQLIRAGKS